jgi:hypothetical protein
MRVSKAASKWYIVVAVLSGALCLTSFFSSTPITNSRTDPRVITSGMWLINTALFALIAFKVRSMSLGWSIIGFLLFLFGVFISVAGGELSPIGLLIELFLFVKLLHAVRAARAWHSFEERTGGASLPSSAPIEPK